jgi:hydroxymethylbilane synthase|tara:strand:- start:242 stop:1174 length:933 start_codon:yes stop_codon:yes gene_type:complete
MSDQKPLRIGTRGSPLALAQAHEVQELLCTNKSLMNMENIPVIKIIKTTGDRVLDRPLKEIGGKGLFSKEIDEALIYNEIDIAVHSMKDLETIIPSGIILAATMKREDPRDVFISRLAASIDELPIGSTIGTSSLRRQAQILKRRPDLVVKPFRGNVQTRMKKMKDGEVDATLLALAGLKRLKIVNITMEILNPDIILPAVAQGAIGITCREEDTAILTKLKALNHGPTWKRITAERTMLAALDGSCRTPIGGLANIDLNGILTLKGILANEDGSKMFTALKEGPAEEAEAIGNNVGTKLRRLAGKEFPI